MPIEWEGNGKWSKECTKCATVFYAEAKTWDDAINIFLYDFSSASIASGTFDGLSTWCKSCKNNRRHNRPDAGHRDVLLKEQGNICGICSKDISFKDRTANIDHDHTTGKNRKILCRMCNVWMAALDNDEWLAKALAYRDFHRKEHNNENN